jgi:4-amino-4-deoxy-L-arabinose transferase-like glycosyltransferase
MNRAGQGQRAGVAQPAGAAEPASPPAPRAGWARATAARPAVRHLALLVVYLAAGIGLTWPRASYLARGVLPKTRDTSGYVWDLWWFAHQISHLSNPFYTGHMAAPFGIQLGFDTSMPLAGLIMTPVTLAFGPSASFSLLTFVAPGLTCYLMYRAARLWLAAPGAIAAGALFGLSSMLAWQDWNHLNIALGTLFLPLTLEAAVRLRRAPSALRGLLLGLVLGGSVLVNQESAVMALVLAVLTLLPWLARRPAARLAPLAVAAGVAVVVGGPQLAAMIQQAVSGGATVSGHLLAHTGASYGVGPAYLFAPSPRVGAYGLTGLAAATTRNAGSVGEGMPMFGVVLTVLALIGLAVSWRRRAAWLLAALWLGCAWLALGPTLWIGGRAHVPVPGMWHGERVSLILPYTWIMRVPLLSDLREADRFALLGLVGAALLAGSAVDWLRRHAWPAIAVVAALAVLEAGWWNPVSVGTMRTALPALDRPIAADHSGSVVVDYPFGLRGGIPLYGGLIPPQALVLATADGHPRGESYTSWVPANTIRQIKDQPFYRLLVGTQNYIPGKPVVVHATPAELAQARANARHMHIGWVIVWVKTNPVVVRYLADTGFRFAYRADGASVYRPVSGGAS